MDMKRIITLAMMVSAIVACGTIERDEINDNTREDNPVTYTQENGKYLIPASYDALTRTQLDGMSVQWTSGDRISVFPGNAAFETSESGASVTFAGTVDPATIQYALYPYSAGASIIGNVISFEIPAEQTATDGSFVEEAAPALATLSAGKLSFKNIGGLIKFSIPVGVDSISSVSLTSAGGEKIAGAATVDASAATPTSVATGTETVRLNAAGRGIPGSHTYYIAAAPATLAGGFTLTMTYADGRSSDVMTGSNAATITRNHVLDLGELTPNLVVNGDFEKLDPRGYGWARAQGNQNNNFDLDAENNIDGRCTLRFSGKTAWGDNSQVVTVEPGARYTLGMTGRILDAAGPSGGTNTNHTLSLALRSLEKVGDSFVVYGSVIITSGTDTEVSTELEIPAGVTSATVIISKSNGIAYMDNIFLRKVR